MVTLNNEQLQELALAITELVSNGQMAARYDMRRKHSECASFIVEMAKNVKAIQEIGVPIPNIVIG